MFDIKVTVTASPELLDVLQKLVGAKSAATAVPAAANPPKMTSVPASNGSAAPATGATNPGTEITVTLEQVRALVTAKSQAGKMPEIKALLTAFGANKVTELPADKYPSFYSEVDKIKIA